MMNQPYADAYCHVGVPRFGRAADAWQVLTQNQIQKAVLVLGPQVPHYTELFAAMATYGSDVRGVGIPFGETAAQMQEIADLQLQAGVLGLRLQPEEVLTVPRLLDQLGEAGRWAYAIGLPNRPSLARLYLNFLQKYPRAQVAAPHFLDPRCLDPKGDDGPIWELLAHPRFYPIFSRHGGVGSRRSYPHDDLRDWVMQVAERAGWERVLWGSEYPVFYWRDERMPDCRSWLASLLDSVDETTLAAFLGGNTERVIFAAEPPPREAVTIPTWVETQFNRRRTVPLFEQNGLALPMSVYAELHQAYVQALQHDPDLGFAAFVIRRLSR